MPLEDLANVLLHRALGQNNGNLNENLAFSLALTLKASIVALDLAHLGCLGLFVKNISALIDPPLLECAVVDVAEIPIDPGKFPISVAGDSTFGGLTGKPVVLAQTQKLPPPAPNA